MKRMFTKIYLSYSKINTLFIYLKPHCKPKCMLKRNDDRRSVGSTWPGVEVDSEVQNHFWKGISNIWFQAFQQSLRIEDDKSIVIYFLLNLMES